MFDSNSARSFGSSVCLAASLALAGSCSSTDRSAGPGAGGDDQAGTAGIGGAIRVGDIAVSSGEDSVQSLEPGTYLRPAPATGAAAIVFEGLVGITIDLSGVELRGQAESADIDGAKGIGILLRGCRDVTLRGGLLGGYRGCLVLEDCQGVTLERVRFDGWFGQRLRSTTYAEDPIDWLRPHENDEGEWLSKYGGAISATDCSRITVKNCRGRRGQNGILLTRVSDAQVYDNDFSFLSGWGLAMYRSTKNTVSHNVFDYCVRGYSHDVYWRGQDSAGILMFERCCDNVIAENSATHCGDGVFLYGGQDIVERGVDGATGSDRNLFVGNDLRFAVANSLEATFSRGNVVIDNHLSGSRQHGIWGGYSSEMVILGNRIEDTIGGGITIEHGQRCVIADNRIGGNEIGVELYWDADPALVDGPFGKSNDTSSRGHWVLSNVFANNYPDLGIRRSTGIIFHDNQYIPGSREPYCERISAESDPSLSAATVERWLDALDGSFPSGSLTDTSLDPWVGQAPPELSEWRAWERPSYPGTQVIGAEARDEFGGGLESILMGEWGPWDFRSGAPRPEVEQPGGELADATWSATWFRWDAASSDPRTAPDAWRARANAPIASAEVGTFVNPWGGDEARRRQIGTDYFGLIAQTEFELAEGGTFRLSTVSDDGIRVLVDGELAIEDWTLHSAQRDDRVVILDAGLHTIRLEYFQIQGAAQLVVDLRGD